MCFKHLWREEVNDNNWRTDSSLSSLQRIECQCPVSTIALPRQRWWRGMDSCLKLMASSKRSWLMHIVPNREWESLDKDGVITGLSWITWNSCQLIWFISEEKPAMLPPAGTNILTERPLPWERRPILWRGEWPPNGLLLSPKLVKAKLTLLGEGRLERRNEERATYGRYLPRNLCCSMRDKCFIVSNKEHEVQRAWSKNKNTIEIRNL